VDYALSPLRGSGGVSLGHPVRRPFTVTATARFHLTLLKRFSTVLFMNKLNTQRRAQIAAALVEGSSVRSTCRMTGAVLHTVLRLLNDLGCACAEYHDKHVRNVRVRRLQCDEIWSFVGAKAKNASLEKKAEGWGDTWTWTAIDADTKLCVSYLVGG
jgi:hypothetical protein